MGIQAGNENFRNKRESLEATPIEVYQEILCQEGTEQVKTRNRPRRAPMRPNRRKWKLQARNPNSNGGNKHGLGTLKRPSCELTGPNLKQKKIKVTSPLKLETKEYQLNLSVAKLNLSWEPVAMEGMKIANSNIEEISAEAGDQPRRKP